MGDGLQFLDIIFFAMIAGFIFLRLRRALGRRTGHERQRPDAYRLGERAERGGDDKVVALPERDEAETGAHERDAKLWAEDSPIGAGLTQIKIADHSFEPDGFLQGARTAYEMVVEAFSKADVETLRMLLADEVYENFERAIVEREEADQTLETSISKLKSAEIVEAQMNGRVAEITVRFVSDMVGTLRDAEGNQVPGAPSGEREVTDVWTFARDTGSRDPNWVLISTSSEH